MDERLKQRLVGATVLVSLGVILAPMVLDRPSEPSGAIQTSNIPPRPENVFRSKIEPVSKAEILGEQTEPEVQATPDRDRGDKDTLALETGSGPPAGAVADSTEATEAAVAPGLSAWAVQLGSFAKPANAFALRDRLRKKGYPAFVESVRMDSREIKRVYVGAELMRAKAAESRRKLEKEVGSRGMIVRYPTG